MATSDFTLPSFPSIEWEKTPSDERNPSLIMRGFLFVFVIFGLLLPSVVSASPVTAGLSDPSGVATSKQCLMCHADPDKLPEGEGKESPLFVASDRYKNSVHGSVKCIECHDEHRGFVHYGQVEKIKCERCHQQEAQAYSKSIHARARVKGSTLAATCTDCHGTSHGILSSENPQSKIYPANLYKTCGDCHSRSKIKELLAQRGISRDRVKLYRESIHARILQNHPDSDVATCNDCHGTHKILPPINPESTLNVFNLSGTCGQCHKQAEKQYRKSLHWKSLKRGNYESPTCIDCHGEHKVEAPVMENGEMKVQATTKVCAQCHSSEVLMSRYGLDADRIETYFKTYHGLAARRGSKKVAACSSCHENHAIRRPENPRSTVHSSNLVETCGQCHGNVTPSFARIDVHPANQMERNPVAYYVRIVYTVLILLVIGGMLVHNLIILLYHILQDLRARQNKPLYQRFQSFEVYQHFLLFVCFAALVLTGFALKFPDSGWDTLLLAAGLNEAARSLLHRIAAVVLVAISLVQLVYFIVSPGGRRDVKSMIPKRDDLLHLWQNIKYHLGWSGERPEYGRFTYAEKAEYIALIWGVLIMGASGIVLWFPGYFLEFLPWWSFETAEVIHYYEAWLATLAIIVWHFFFVMFHPEVYPLDLTFLDGKISEDELKHHHPREYERLKDGGEKSDE